MKTIGIVCEGPTDQIVISRVVDMLTGGENKYFKLQPEETLTGKNGNGWKGVVKWCRDNWDDREKLMHQVQPEIDFLIVHMDGDVSRKEKSAHCGCSSSADCPIEGTVDPLDCDKTPEGRAACPIQLPCLDHGEPIGGYIKHLTDLISKGTAYQEDVCIVIPCDSIEAWIVAAFDKVINAEMIENPWENVVSKKKNYHDIRVRSGSKNQRAFAEFAGIVCENWSDVTRICETARIFETDIQWLTAQPLQQ